MTDDNDTPFHRTVLAQKEFKALGVKLLAAVGRQPAGAAVMAEACTILTAAILMSGFSDEQERNDELRRQMGLLARFIDEGPRAFQAAAGLVPPKRLH